MEKIFLLWIHALLSCVTAQGFVKLSGNQQIKRFGTVKLNCSSNHTPIGKEARIQIDGKPYTTITSLSVGCLSSVWTVVCHPDQCACSNRGLWFSHTYEVVQHIGVVNFTCLMTFRKYGSYSNSISVKVIGPTITTEPGLPLPPASNVAFICMVETLSTKISVEWDCLGKVEHNSRRVSKFNSTKYSSVIMRNIHLHHDGETCRCHINVDGISGNFEISLAISRKPIIYISKAATCESSSTVTLFCVIHTGFPLFGFHQWIHTRHGKFIRHLEGDTIYTKSVLKFDSCSHDDTGDYTCEAYNRYHDNTTFANKTVSLFVYASPAFFDLRIVAFGIIALGIFILTASGTVIMSKGIRRINDIHIIGPNERCPTIPIYHSAPALDNTQNAYDTPKTGYLQVINEQYELNHFQDTEIAEEENSTLGSDYEEIDV